MIRSSYDTKKDPNAAGYRCASFRTPLGSKSASVLVQTIPFLTGMPFAHGMLPLDPDLPLPFKTISPAYHFTIPFSPVPHVELRKERLR